MKLKSRLVITFSALLLVIALLLVVIFAFRQNTYDVNTTMSVSASERVRANITASMKNDGHEVKLDDNTIDIEYNLSIATTKALNLPKQTLKQKGSKVVVTLEVANKTKSAYDFNIKFNEDTIRSAQDKHVSLDFKYTYNDAEVLSEDVATTNIEVGKAMTITITITLESEAYNVCENLNIDLGIEYIFK